MSDMVERVARALAFLNCSDQAEADHCWQSYCDDARAAIEAMREPTEDMCDEAECATPFSFEAMWKAAIDEALRQKDPPQ